MFENKIPDGFKSIGKIYLVEYDNGKEYEDNDTYIESVFKTRDDAERYLDSKYERKYIKCWPENSLINGVEWRCPKFVCSMKNIDCEKCPKCNGDCDGYWERIGSEYEGPSWYILEYDLIEKKVV